MKNWQKWLLGLVFYGAFGFAGGGSFLMFLMVPLERWLVKLGWSQVGIDRTLGPMVYGWFVIALVVTLVYYHKVVDAKPPRPRLVYGIAGASVLAAGLVFFALLDTDLGVIASRQGSVREVTTRFTFGPYPELSQMQQLKQEGYDGVVSLLHPSIPFETVLIAREENNARQVGIPLYHFPMLPWISDNREAESNFKKLMRSSGKRYYIHCYLGTHRVALVRQWVLEGQREEGARAASVPLPATLDRGMLLTYDNKRIVVGPFPSDDEWYLSIVGTGVREVVSILDPNKPDYQPFQEKAQKVCKEAGLRFTSKPVNTQAPSVRDVQDLADYLRKTDHKVFVVGIRNGNWTWALDAALGGGGAPFPTSIRKSKFERGDLLRVNTWLILGPYPTDDEIGQLRAAGVKEIVSLLDERNKGDAPWVLREAVWSQLYGFHVTRFPVHGDTITPAQVQQVVDYLRTQSGPVYVHGFLTDKRVSAVYDAARGIQAQGGPAAPPPGN
jgi:protein tyrosine phosphatase (PTP) superfamily phosphohydrolase (DUF442 family)